MPQPQSGHLESGKLYRLIEASEWSGGDIVLGTAYPTYAQGRPHKQPREIIFYGGTLVVNDEQGTPTTTTLPQDLEKIPIHGIPYSIDDTSTATAVYIVW